MIRTIVPNLPGGKPLSIPDQQPTVASTKDLSLPVDFLPGEDDVKLKEGTMNENLDNQTPSSFD